MNFDSGTAYAESDADDEYERDIHGSSPIATDVETSPIDSGPSSTEHTPTTYGYHSSADRLPETIISEWTAEECADFIATIGVQQYADRFIGTHPRIHASTSPTLLLPGMSPILTGPSLKRMTLSARLLLPYGTTTSKQWGSTGSATDWQSSSACTTSKKPRMCRSSLTTICR